MKILSWVVSLCVLGVGLSFLGALYTARKVYVEKRESQVIQLPTPAAPPVMSPSQ